MLMEKKRNISLQTLLIIMGSSRQLLMKAETNKVNIVARLFIVVGLIIDVFMMVTYSIC